MNMETVEIQHKGYIISHLKVPLMGATFAVNVGSKDLNLAMRLQQTVFDNHRSFKGGIALAKRYIDSIVQ